MPDRSDTLITVLVEIRVDRPLALGVIPGDLDALERIRLPLTWIPRSEIREMQPESGNRTLLTIPHWLADEKRLLSETEDNANQGSLL